MRRSSTATEARFEKIEDELARVRLAGLLLVEAMKQLTELVRQLDERTA